MADSDKFKVGSIYKYEEPMPEFDDNFEPIPGTVSCMLKIEGPVIYNDGTTAIIKVRNMDPELEDFILYYNEVCERFKDFAAIENKPSYILQEYFCIDIMNEKSRFYKHWVTGQIHDAVFDEDGFFLGYDYDDSEFDEFDEEDEL